MKDKIGAALNILDGLADVWGDEARFRRARDMLREALRSTADDHEPITAEWCVANEATSFSAQYACWELGEFVVYWDGVSNCVEVDGGDCGISTQSITTCGRLRHLLAALREGDE